MVTASLSLSVRNYFHNSDSILDFTMHTFRSVSLFRHFPSCRRCVSSRRIAERIGMSDVSNRQVSVLGSRIYCGKENTGGRGLVFISPRDTLI